MDESVRQAMARWPNVPHCYGWLALDARGAWRMRDERAQALGLAGDRIVHTALVGFINRNYTHDERGCWYFQNGPQRVYVNLEVTPYIAHTDPAQGFVLHTGEPLVTIDAVWMTGSGQLVLASDERVALLDDRDLAQCLSDLRCEDETVTDEKLMAWLNEPKKMDTLRLNLDSRSIPVQYIEHTAIPAHFDFVQVPRQD